MNKYKKMRMDAGISLRELARLSEIDVSMLSKMENGIANPTKRAIRAYYVHCEGLDTETYKITNRDVATGKNTALRLLKKRKIKRVELELALGVDDRTVREYIHELRKDGICVLNMQDGEGYFIPTQSSPSDVLDTQVFVAQELSRIKNAQVGIDAAQLFLRKVENNE